MWVNTGVLGEQWMSLCEVEGCRNEATKKIWGLLKIPWRNILKRGRGMMDGARRDVELCTAHYNLFKFPILKPVPLERGVLLLKRLRRPRP